MTPDQIAHDRVKKSFERQGMLRVLGVELVHVQVGQVEIRLPYSDAVTQQQGGYHGGAMGALADVAAGYAGLTVAPPDSEVTTVEYKINFLASFQGGYLHAIGKVVRAGKRIIVTTAEVSHRAPDGQVRDCALMQQTLAPVAKTY
jgi:uncharacterized protein (TIGR00369 family)